MDDEDDDDALVVGVAVPFSYSVEIEFPGGERMVAAVLGCATKATPCGEKNEEKREWESDPVLCDHTEPQTHRYWSEGKSQNLVTQVFGVPVS